MSASASATRASASAREARRSAELSSAIRSPCGRPTSPRRQPDDQARRPRCRRRPRRRDRRRRGPRRSPAATRGGLGRTLRPPRLAAAPSRRSRACHSPDCDRTMSPVVSTNPVAGRASRLGSDREHRISRLVGTGIFSSGRDDAVADPDDAVGDDADLRVVGDDQQGPVLAASPARGTAPGSARRLESRGSRSARRPG